MIFGESEARDLHFPFKIARSERIAETPALAQPLRLK
jgi:hypothetical protein